MLEGEKERWKQMMAWRDSGGQRVARASQTAIVQATESAEARN